MWHQRPAFCGHWPPQFIPLLQQVTLPKKRACWNFPFARRWLHASSSAKMPWTNLAFLTTASIWTFLTELDFWQGTGTCIFSTAWHCVLRALSVEHLVSLKLLLHTGYKRLDWESCSLPPMIPNTAQNSPATGAHGAFSPAFRVDLTAIDALRAMPSTTPDPLLFASIPVKRRGEAWRNRLSLRENQNTSPCLPWPVPPPYIKPYILVKSLSTSKIWQGNMMKRAKVWSRNALRLILMIPRASWIIPKQALTTRSRALCHVPPSLWSAIASML